MLDITRRFFTQLQQKLQIAIFVAIFIFVQCNFGTEALADAGKFTILNADTSLVNKVYRLSATLQFNLSVDVQKAIENGLPITLELDIEILRPREYFWPEEIALLKQLYQLQYHALSQQYVVKNINSSAHGYFQTLDAALTNIGSIEALPLLDESLLDPNQKYIMRVRTGIDIDALPVPLRLLAYFSSAWRLTSEWFTRSL